MKKIISIAVVIVGVFCSFTAIPKFYGKRILPKNIAPSFSAQYPDAKIKNWVEKGDEFIVNFVDGKQKCEAYYSPDGRWIQSRIKMAWTKDLPMAVRQSLDKNGYGAWYVDEIREVRSPGKVAYRVHVDNGTLLDADHYDVFKTDYVLNFAPDGTLIKKREIVQ